MKTEPALALAALGILLVAALPTTIAETTGRQAVVIEVPVYQVALAGRPVEPGVRGPVAAMTIENVAVAGNPIEPSSKGPVPHLDLVVGI